MWKKKKKNRFDTPIEVFSEVMKKVPISRFKYIYNTTKLENEQKFLTH